MSLVPGERLNTGYVGVINSTFVPLFNIRDAAYYIPIIGDLGSSKHQLMLSRGAVGDMLSMYNTNYVQAQFGATRSETVDNGWSISIFDIGGVFKGYLRFVYDEDEESIIATISTSSPSTIILTPLEASGYGNGALLAGIRYSMSIQSGEIIRFPITNSQPASGNLGGLYIGATRIDRYESVNSSSIIFTPTHPASYLERTPPSMGLLTQSVGISQCITMAGTGYGNSQYCVNWIQSRGFTREEDVQPIIYFYSQDGTCGQSYTEGGIQIPTSIGDSCDEDEMCSYANDQFDCRRDGIFRQSWFWIVLGFIILIILIVIAGAVILG